MFGYILIMFLPKLCMGIFTSDKNAVDTGVHILRIMSLFIPLVAVQITGSVYFQAIGKPLPSLILGLSRQMIILIPLLLILPLFSGLNGIWYAFPLSDFLSTGLTMGFLLVSLRKIGKLSMPQRPMLDAEES